MKKNVSKHFKNKKYLYLGIIILFFIIIIINLSQNRDQDLYRIYIKNKNVQKKLNYKKYSFSFNKINSNISLYKNWTIKSFNGTAIIGKAVTKKKHIKIYPNLKGKYIMDLFYFFFPGEKKSSELLLIHRWNKNKFHIHKMKDINQLNQYQLKFDLEKDDILEFVLKGDGVALISDPVFYKNCREKEKNFVFIIVADTLRYDHIGIYNNKKKCTPNIDLFSKNAVIFNNAFSTSSWTLPAHMSLFTSLFPNSHDINYGNTQLTNKQKTLFEFIQKKFMTISFCGSAFVSHRYGFARDFNLYYEVLREAENMFASKSLFDKAMNYIPKVKNKHTLLFLHTYQTHTPYNPENEITKKYFKQKLKWKKFSTIKFLKSGKKVEIFKKTSKEDLEEIIKIYDAGVFTFDYRFGEFIKFLKKKNIYHNSTIILLSDHGEEFKDHEGWEHGHSLYNELIKIPLLVKFPNNKFSGLKVDKIVSIVDILPTILELYDINLKGNIKIDGISLLKTIKNYQKKRKIISYLAPYALRNKIPKKIAIISDKLKMIYNEKMKPTDFNFFSDPPPKIPVYELYDIFKDPLEKINLAQKLKSELNKMIEFKNRLKFKTGRKGYHKELKKDLKTLGYI